MLVTRCSASVAKATAKRDLPTKVCPVCDRPFTWRKKWERDWENVKHCSDRCRRDAKNQEPK